MKRNSYGEIAMEFTFVSGSTNDVTLFHRVDEDSGYRIRVLPGDNKLEFHAEYFDYSKQEVIDEMLGTGFKSVDSAILACKFHAFYIEAYPGQDKRKGADVPVTNDPLGESFDHVRLI